jgi:hypothetical protein
MESATNRFANESMNHSTKHLFLTLNWLVLLQFVQRMRFYAPDPCLNRSAVSAGPSRGRELGSHGLVTRSMQRLQRLQVLSARSGPSIGSNFGPTVDVGYNEAAWLRACQSGQLASMAPLTATRRSRTPKLESTDTGCISSGNCRRLKHQATWLL